MDRLTGSGSGFGLPAGGLADPPSLADGLRSRIPVQLDEIPLELLGGPVHLVDRPGEADDHRFTGVGAGLGQRVAAPDPGQLTRDDDLRIGMGDLPGFQLGSPVRQDPGQDDAVENRLEVPGRAGQHHDRGAVFVFESALEIQLDRPATVRA